MSGGPAALSSAATNLASIGSAIEALSAQVAAAPVAPAESQACVPV
ncbi:hypothetical protein [Mycobacterium riyadhense]|nr:hypothetical protein [Mycobacterium riyadhense]